MILVCLYDPEEDRIIFAPVIDWMMVESEQGRRLDPFVLVPDESSAFLITDLDRGGAKTPYVSLGFFPQGNPEQLLEAGRRILFDRAFAEMRDEAGVDPSGEDVAKYLRGLGYLFWRAVDDAKKVRSDEKGKMN